VGTERRLFQIGGVASIAPGKVICFFKFPCSSVSPTAEGWQKAEFFPSSFLQDSLKEIHILIKCQPKTCLSKEFCGVPQDQIARV